jgi:hypothetical protein
MWKYCLLVAALSLQALLWVSPGEAYQNDCLARAAVPSYAEGQSVPCSLRLDGGVGTHFLDLLGGEHVDAVEENGYIRVQPRAGVVGGADGYTRISAGATEDKHEIKATPGTLYSITATNTNAAVRYVKCENDTAANTAPGTDTPELRLAIPGNAAGAGVTTTFPVGYSFSVALTCWLVTGAADSDVTEVAANEIMVFYTFK